ncbi:MAG: hypothetical protein E6R03_02875 [Hyphomicrobiaceae bacterium]|nr:MAG: hypothetical protein E6R03_02875 [Hyphomicrobiaceae bacterium]
MVESVEAFVARGGYVDSVPYDDSKELQYRPKLKGKFSKRRYHGNTGLVPLKRDRGWIDENKQKRGLGHDSFLDSDRYKVGY